MPNILGLYDPLFYATEALTQLEKALGLASRVHHHYAVRPEFIGQSFKRKRVFLSLC